MIAQRRRARSTRCPALLWLLSVWLLSAPVAGCAHSSSDRYVDDVTLKGVEAIDDDELRSGLANKQTPWWRYLWPFGDYSRFDRLELRRDLARITAFYQRRGYYGAKVLSHRVQLDGDDAVDLHFVVDEGQPTSVAELRVEGLEGLPTDLRDQLRGTTTLDPGERFDYARYADIKSSIERRLKLAGYAWAEVEGDALVDRAERRAKLEITVKPGERMRLGSPLIDALGARRKQRSSEKGKENRSKAKAKGTKDSGDEGDEGAAELPDRLPKGKIAAMAAWEPGDIYSPTAIAVTRARLARLRLFSRIEIELPRSDVERARPLIRLQMRKKTDELRLGGGVGVERRRQEVRLEGRWTLRNLLGGLRVLTLQLRPAYVSIPAFWDGQRRGFAVAVLARLDQPQIFETEISAFVSAGYDLEVEPGYRSHGPRFALGAEHPFFSDRLRVGASWHLRYLNFYDINNEAFNEAETILGGGFVDPYRLAYLEQRVTLDLRDDGRYPSRGFFARVSVEEGASFVGGAFSYLKLTGDLRGYVPLGTRRLVVALRLLIGHMWPSSPQDSPVTQRFFLGGPNSHRGFAYGRFSPQIDTSQGRIPVGGESALLGQLDLRIAVMKIAGNWLGLAPFFDAGQVAGEFAELTPDKLHLAVGASLQYDTPIGVVRAGVGVRLNRTSAADEPSLPDPGDRFAFHITIGAAF